MSSAESHFGLLDSVVHSVEMLCEGAVCCLGRRKRVSVLCFLNKIYHRADNVLYEYLHHFVAARNIRALVALGELLLVILCCRTVQFSHSFLPAAVRLYRTCCDWMRLAMAP